MTYQISRDGQEFGPYSLADVQRYVGTGNILLTDLARAEGSTEWISVSQVVGTIPAMQPQVPVAYAPASMYPDAPDLNWAIVLLLSIVTCGLFTIAWNLIQALWIKKVQPETKALLFYLIVIGLAVINVITSAGRMALLLGSRGQVHRGMYPMIGISAVFTIASLVMQWIIYPFAMRDSLLKHFNQADPVGLQLSPVMTFFFGSLYFQYHINRINEIKRGFRPVMPY